jgi:hypothetical protein
MTQNNLGGALQTLGAREAGTARLEEAVTAYRAALEERTRDRVPLDWAGTEYNLSLAKERIADRMADRDAARAVYAELIPPLREALAEFEVGNPYMADIVRKQIANLEAKAAGRP